MNKETCLCVMAHTGAAATVSEFYPKWAACGLDVIGFYPVGDDTHPLFQRVFHVGESAHRGNKVFHRFVDTVEVTCKLGYHRIVLIEYDCVPLRPLLPMWFDGSFTSTLERDLHSFGVQDNHQVCSYCPYIYTQDVGMQLVESARTHLDADGDAQRFDGLLDRWLHYACEKARLKPFSVLDSGGWVHNMTPENIEMRGFNWCHGYKSKERFGHLWKDET